MSFFSIFLHYPPFSGWHNSSFHHSSFINPKNSKWYCSILFVEQNVKEDVGKRDKDIEHAKKLGESIAESSNDPETTKKVNEKIKKIKEPVNEIKLKVNERCELLKSSLTDSQSYHDNLDEFLRWLTTTERTLAKETPISGNPEECSVQQKDVEVRIL